MKKVILLLIMGLLVGLMAVGCQQEAEETEVPVGSTINSVASADGLEVKYEVIGLGEPALVFVHCWCCDRTYWRNQVPEFSGKYKVVTIDVGGHGESGIDREDWTMASYGSDVAAVVNELGLSKVILVGHSMGGWVILHAASQLGDKVLGVVGVDTYQDFEAKSPPEQIDAFLASFQADFPTRTKEYVSGLFPENADTVLKKWIVDDMSQAPPEVALSAFRDLFSTNLVELLEEVQVPIRSISTDRWYTNVNSNREHAESFDVKLMPGMGHFIHMEDPAQFNKLLQEWIDDLTEQGEVASTEN